MFSGNQEEESSLKLNGLLDFQTMGPLHLLKAVVPGFQWMNFRKFQRLILPLSGISLLKPSNTLLLRSA